MSHHVSSAWKPLSRKLQKLICDWLWLRALRTSACLTKLLEADKDSEKSVCKQPNRRPFSEEPPDCWVRKALPPANCELQWTEIAILFDLIGLQAAGRSAAQAAVFRADNVQPSQSAWTHKTFDLSRLAVFQTCLLQAKPASLRRNISLTRLIANDTLLLTSTLLIFPFLIFMGFRLSDERAAK